MNNLVFGVNGNDHFLSRYGSRALSVRNSFNPAPAMTPTGNDQYISNVPRKKADSSQITAGGFVAGAVSVLAFLKGKKFLGKIKGASVKETLTNGFKAVKNKLVGTGTKVEESVASEGASGLKNKIKGFGTKLKNKFTRGGSASAEVEEGAKGLKDKVKSWGSKIKSKLTRGGSAAVEVEEAAVNTKKAKLKWAAPGASEKVKNARKVSKLPVATEAVTEQKLSEKLGENVQSILREDAQKQAAAQATQQTATQATQNAAQKAATQTAQQATTKAANDKLPEVIHLSGPVVDPKKAEAVDRAFQADIKNTPADRMAKDAYNTARNNGVLPGPAVTQTASGKSVIHLPGPTATQTASGKSVIHLPGPAATQTTSANSVIHLPGPVKPTYSSEYIDRAFKQDIGQTTSKKMTNEAYRILKENGTVSAEQVSKPVEKEVNVVDVLKATLKEQLKPFKNLFKK